MKLLLLIGVLALGSMGAKTPPQDEKTCEDTCNKKYTKPYRDCNGVAQCQLYVTNQAKRCILKCEGQSGE